MTICDNVVLFTDKRLQMLITILTNLRVRKESYDININIYCHLHVLYRIDRLCIIRFFVIQVIICSYSDRFACPDKSCLL